MKLVLNYIYYIFISAIILLSVLLFATLIPIPGNFEVKIVKSGSMEPTIKTGGIVFIAPSQNYKLGDVITFGQDTKTQIPTTHRIVKVEGEGSSKKFITKGDANDAEDPNPVSLSSVNGKVLFSMPYLGFVLDFAKKPLGFVFLVGIPALSIIVDELGKIIKEIRAIRRKKLINAEQKEQINTIH